MRILINRNVDNWLTNCLLVFFSLTIVCLIVPFSPIMPMGNLDPSWSFGMNQALAQGMAIGSDVIFTFGPYASIYTKTYHPATDQLMIFGSLYLAFSYGLAFFLLAKKNNWLLVGLFLLFLVSALVLLDPLYFSYPLLVSVLCLKENGFSMEGKPKRNQTIAEIIILFSPFGLLPLVKGSFLLICAIAVALAGISFSLRKEWRLVFAVVVVPILSAIVFWSLAGQEPLGLYVYLKSLGPIISGYTEAMAVDGRRMEIFIYLFSAFVLLIVVIGAQVIEPKHRFLTFIAFAAYLFIAFKSGFVRHDGHAQIAGIAIVIATFIAAFALRSKYLLIVFVISISVWIYINHHYASISTNVLINRLKSTYTSTWQGLMIRLAGGDEIKTSFGAAIKKINNEAKFPLFGGTTDIYSFNQSFLIASGNTWNPRPVFQSYSVYTPLLAKVNKEHLLGQAAPDNVIFRVEPIDGRLPSAEDGSSWPPLLSSYEPSRLSNGFLYLHRKLNVTHPNEEIFLTSGNYSFGETVQVPKESTPIFVEVLIKPSLIGRLVNIFYKPSQLQIELQLESGRKANYRIISGMASSGFVLSPLVETTDEFGLLFAGLRYLNNKKVKSFSISPKGQRYLWEQVYHVTFKRLDLAQQINLSNIYEFNKILVNSHNNKISVVDKCDGSIDAINGVAPGRQSFVNNLIKVNGWLAKSVENGNLADTVLVTLRDSSGKYRLLSTNKVIRPDVGAYFKKPQLDSAGFETIVDIEAISGDYMLGLAYREGNHVRVCPQFNIPVSFQ